MYIYIYIYIYQSKKKERKKKPHWWRWDLPTPPWIPPAIPLTAAIESNLLDSIVRNRQTHRHAPVCDYTADKRLLPSIREILYTYKHLDAPPATSHRIAPHRTGRKFAPTSIFFLKSRKWTLLKKLRAFFWHQNGWSRTISSYWFNAI